MKKLRRTTFKVLGYLIIISLLIFCIFYDLALADINFPVLTSIYFVVFILIRFGRKLFR